MKRLIVSAPFGNYLNFKGATSTVGTFTYNHRGGFWKRLWRALLTVRCDRRNGSWTNRLGLPNPGLYTILEEQVRGKILSIHGSTEYGWFALAYRSMELKPLAIELNLSCPNVTSSSAADLVETVTMATQILVNGALPFMAKLPPLRWMNLAAPLYELGCRQFHCCNTIPVPSGGMSGKPLKQYSLWALEDLRREFGDTVDLIGGGGVTCLQDVKDYLSAGADRVAVASMLFNPLRWKLMREFSNFLEIYSKEIFDE